MTSQLCKKVMWLKNGELMQVYHTLSRDEIVTVFKGKPVPVKVVEGAIDQTIKASDIKHTVGFIPAKDAIMTPVSLPGSTSQSVTSSASSKQVYHTLSRDEIVTAFKGKPVPVKVVEGAIDQTIKASDIKHTVGFIPSVVPAKDAIMTPVSLSGSTSQSVTSSTSSKPANPVISLVKTIPDNRLLFTPRSKSVPIQLFTSPKASVSTTKVFATTTTSTSNVNSPCMVGQPANKPATVTLKGRTVVLSNQKPLAILSNAPCATAISSSLGIKSNPSSKSSSSTSSLSSSSPLSLPTNSTVTLRKIPGTEDFVIEKSPNSSTTSNQIPVGKVHPLQVSDPKSIPLQTRWPPKHLLHTTKVYSYDPNVTKTPQNPVMLVNKEPNKPPRITNLIITKSSGALDLQDKILPTQSVSATKTQHTTTVNSYDPNVTNTDTPQNPVTLVNTERNKPPKITNLIPTMPSPTFKIVTSELVKRDEVASSTERTSSPESLKSPPGPIPMKITALLYDNGPEVRQWTSASRDDKTKDLETNLEDGNKETRVCTPPCTPSEISQKDSRDIESLGESQATGQVAMEGENERPQTLQNVYARVYLAPDENDDTKTDDAPTPSLKIDSVFSLKEDDIKKFFPDSESPADDTSANNISAASSSDDTVAFQVKQEPPDSSSETEFTTATGDSITANIKEEPEDTLPQVKDEPADEYSYSSYSIPDDEEGTTGEAPTSIPKIKDEPEDSTPDTISQSTAKLQLVVNQSSEPPQPVAKQSHTPNKSKSGVSASLASGAQLLVDGQRLSIAGGEGIVTNVNGKRFIIISAPGHSILKADGQGQTKIMSRPKPPLLPTQLPRKRPSGGGKNYLVTMADGKKRLVHLPEGTAASTLLATLSKGKIVQMAANPIPVKSPPSKTTGQSVKSPPGKKTGQSVVIDRTKGGSGILCNLRNKLLPEVRYQQDKTLSKPVLTSTFSPGALTPPSTTVVATLGPATKLMKTIISRAQRGDEPSSLPMVKIVKSEPKQVEKDEHLRRGTRDRKLKRRYSPPPIGPKKRQYKTEEAPSSDSESTESADSDHGDGYNTNNDSTPTTPPVTTSVKPASKKRQHEASTSDEAPKLKRCSPESVQSDLSDKETISSRVDQEPAQLTPAVASREDRMRLLKGLIKEKEAALEMMRKRRQEELEARKNDPDLMDDGDDDNDM